MDCAVLYTAPPLPFSIRFSFRSQAESKAIKFPPVFTFTLPEVAPVKVIFSKTNVLPLSTSKCCPGHDISQRSPPLYRSQITVRSEFDT